MLPQGSLIGCNPYEELPQIRVICEALGVKPGPQPTAAKIHDLFLLGKGKVYGANAEELPIDTSKLYQDEVLDAIDELLAATPLRTVHDMLGPGAPRDAEPGIFHAEDPDYRPLMEVGFAGTERWDTRRAAESDTQRDNGLKIDWLVLLAGTRPHEDKAGASSYVDAFKQRNKGSLPVEYQLLTIIRHEVAGQRPDDVICVSNDLDDNAREFARRYQSELQHDRCIYIATNAAAEDKIFQIRSAIREIVPGFDADPANPQLYFSSDGFQVGRTPDTDPAQAQRAETFLSYIPRIVKQLHELRS